MTNNLKNNLSQSLFWDVNIDDINEEIHAKFIIERVLSRGTLEDFKLIKLFYGEEKLKTLVVDIRNLDKKVLSFCVAYFDIPKTDFKCYNYKLLNQIPSNY